MDTSNCIFCKIIAKEAPSKLVFEDEQFIGFETKEPVVDGHILVVPKNHAATVPEMDQESLAALGGALSQSAQIVVDDTGATGFNILQANGKDAQQSVFHVHFHIIPRHKDDGLDLWIKQGL